MIKIIFVTNNLGSGGAERVFQILMNNLDRGKFIVQCILIDKILHNAYLKKDVALYELKGKTSINTIWKIRNIIKRSNADIILGTITPVNIILPLIKLTLHLRNRPQFLVRESTVMSHLGKRYGFKNKLANEILKKIYPSYRKIICQSLDIRDDLIQNFNVDPLKLQIINNPIQIVPYQNSSKFNSGKIQFITVGRMRPEKGHVRILEALDHFEKTYGLEYQYHIVGDFYSDEMETSIRKKVIELDLDNKVEFHGHVDEPEHILRKCDVFLQGSYFEGFPNAVLESCSMGVPVVAYDVAGGTKEIIKPGFNGFLAEDNSKYDYADKIMKTLNTEFTHTAMADDIKERFGHEKIVKEYQDFFIALMKEK
ncbi:MAG: glycosyltransferase [Saprospiraceae bacterium]